MQDTVKKERLLILDGSSLLYRAFYALPDLTNSHGEHTNAIHGFASMLSRIISEFEPMYMAIAFDKGKNTFRNELFAEYKGTRDKTPEGLIEQIPLLKEMISAYNIPFLELDNYEADDIIGTLATKAGLMDIDTIIVTGDRDELQLIGENIRVAMTKKGISEYKLYDEESFSEEYELEPILMTDLKGLMGDSSDNIPGIPKVGIKTATKLLKEYGNLDNVLASAEKVSGKKLQESLIVYREQAILSKKLATIELNVPDVEFIKENFILNPDRERMKAFCVRYELNSAWRSFSKLFGTPNSTIKNNSDIKDSSINQSLFVALDDEAISQVTPKTSIASIRLDIEDIDLAKELQEASIIALAGEFSGKIPCLKLKTLGLAFIKEDVKSSREDNMPISTLVINSSEANWEKSLNLIKELLNGESVNKPLVLANLKSYLHVGLISAIRSNILDIYLADYLLQPENNRRDYFRLVSTYLGEVLDKEIPDIEDKIALDAEIALCLYQSLGEKLNEKSLRNLYDDIELPLVEVLASMEATGIYVNKEKLEIALVDMTNRIEDIQQDIYQLVGEAFNINSPKQLGEILFEKLQMPATKKTKSGYSTDAEVLEGLKYHHPVILRILEYRQLTKLRSTYLEGIGELIHKDTGRVYASFNQMVTATGRLSSSDPNLQNIPVRTSEGRAIRTLFEPSDGYDLILSADYSQIELRLLAHMSKDSTFIDAFNKAQDIHRRTAAEVFGVPLDKVTDEQRYRAKAVNFGIVYGISDYGLAKDLGIARKEASHYITSYFERYHGVKDFLDSTIAKAKSDGYVTTMFNRRRDLIAINSRNFNQRSFAERMAMNTPIQGSAADVIKLAMIEVYRKLQAKKLKSRLLIQVHDELVLEVVQYEINEVINLLKDSMENVIELDVPLVIDIHSGTNWAEAK